MNVKRIVIFGFITFASCKSLSPQEESLLTKVGTTILCTIQSEELNDPLLNKECEAILGALTPVQREAIKAHAMPIRHTVPPAKCEGKDGGN